eukprot:UN11104
MGVCNSKEGGIHDPASMSNLDAPKTNKVAVVTHATQAKCKKLPISSNQDNSITEQVNLAKRKDT